MRTKNWIRPVLIVSVVLFFAGSVHCAAINRAGSEESSYGNEQAYYPAQKWEASVPEEQGVRSSELQKSVDNISTGYPDIYSLLIVKNGHLIYENYYKKGMPDRADLVHSVTKSFMSSLIGIAIDKGYIKSVDQKIIEFFPDSYTKDLEPDAKEITLHHLLTMSSGYKWDDQSDDLWRLIYSPNWVKFILGSEQIKPPGFVFNYNTALSHLLSAILTQATQMSTQDFAEKFLFGPLGIKSKNWTTDPQGIYSGGFGLHLTPREMAKLGYLYLKNGNWNKKQIISEQWVKESTKSQIKGYYDYGYQWWIIKTGGFPSYRAWGRRGQFIVVIPDLDSVIVVTSETSYPHPQTGHYSNLLDSIASAIAKGPLFVPRDVQSFIDQYTQDMLSRDLEKVLSHYSDQFQIGFIDKKAVETFWKGYLPNLKSCRIYLTEFRPVGNMAHIEGVMMTNLLGKSYLRFPLIIKEKDRWKFYGSDEHRFTPGKSEIVPKDVQEFLDQYSEDISYHDIEKVMSHYSDRFLLDGRDKDMTEKWLRQIIHRIDFMEVRLSNFEQENEKAHVKGKVKTNLIEQNLVIPMIIKENGHWKWFGNQKR